ncbi:MAG: sigma-E processing peptidase SpoIIGA [Lachnospiraceae bacterium]|nr:sigma-E processing peptidase SpoIIGA [Lachnospiraceae bacterium]
MQSVLYIDVLFCVNWMMDAAVLLLAGRLLKRRFRPLAVSAAAAGGALWVCLCAAFGLSGGLTRLLSLGPAACGMIWIACRPPSARELLRAVLCLYVSAIALGGLIHVVYDGTTFGRFWRLWMAGQEAEAISVWLLTAAMAASLLAAECALRYREASRCREYIQDITLTYKGRQLTVAALWDSGNQLYDPFTGKAVHILELSACEELLGAETCRRLTWLTQAAGLPQESGGDAWGDTPAYLVPCQSLGDAHGLLPVMALESLRGTGGFYEKTPLIGFCTTPLSKEKNYRMLLHSRTDKKRRN